MPHDRIGRPLQVGDTVYVPCEVIAVNENDFCNVGLKTIYPCFPGRHPVPISVNGGQVEKKVEEGEPVSPNKFGT